MIATPEHIAAREAAYIADPRWTRVGNGWQTTDSELVTEGMRRLRASKVSGPNGGYPAAFFKDSDDPTQRVEATTTPEGAKGWADPAGSAHVRTGGHGLNVTPDASPEGVRAEARRREQDGGDEPSNVPNAVIRDRVHPKNLRPVEVASTEGSQ